MKKYYPYILGATNIVMILWLIILSVICSNLASSKDYLYEQPSQNNTSQNDIPSGTNQSTAGFDHYLIMSQDGEVSVYEVFSNGEKKLNSYLDINLSLLTDTDKKAFESGIKIYSDEDLTSLIEDFTS